jgi:hypothetical protein
MKTSSKTSVALLAILALGGSTAGSLFSESLQTNGFSSIGSAGTFFPDRQIQLPTQRTNSNSEKPSSDVKQDLPKAVVLVIAVTPSPEAAPQILAIASQDTASLQTFGSNSKPTPDTSVPAQPKIDPSQTPVISLEVLTPQIPEVQPELPVLETSRESPEPETNLEPAGQLTESE